MKVCPFCREEIRDEAIRCRYCGSSLVPGLAETPPAAPGEPAAGSASKTTGPDRVVYVLDQGLVRFGKFAAALLAIFITVGATLWGFDIKQSTDKVREIADKVRDAQDSVRATQQEIQKTDDSIKQAAREAQAAHEGLRAALGEVEKAKATIVTLQKQTEQSAAKAESALTAINDMKKEADRRVALIPVGRPGASPSETSAGASITSPNAGFSVPQLTRLYNFPTEHTGKGQTVGLITLGGGYRESDLQTYFKRLALPKPDVSWVSVDGGKNRPGDPFGADSEVTMNIEVVGAAAPGARIVVYIAPSNDRGILNAVTAAVNDRTNRPTVLCLTWGMTESNWKPAERDELNQVLKTAAERGMTVLAAAGDSGVTDGVDDGHPHVDLPAASPYVLACGGTRLKASDSAILSERVWDDILGATGGGFSAVFPRPEWQADLKVTPLAHGGTGRALPDVAANAAPESGYIVYIQGQTTVVGGTAAATALWAGLIARINEALGHNVGHLNPTLYTKLGPAGVFRPITEGNNSFHDVSGYQAAPGWNPCTGWGTPDGKKLLEALKR